MADEPSYWRFFCLLEPVRLLDAAAGDGRQLRPHVLRLGRRGPVQLPADRLLVHGSEEGRGRHEGVRGQPLRRLRLHPRPVLAVLGAGRRVARSTASTTPTARPSLRYEAVHRRAVEPAHGAPSTRDEARACRASSSTTARATSVKVGPTLNFRELRDQIVITSTGVAEQLESVRSSSASPLLFWSASASSSAPPARARSCPCTCGCPTPWPAPRRCRRSSTPPPWSPPACT